MLSLSRVGLAGLLAIATGTAPALADVIFTDGTFNLANYSASPTLTSDPSAGIVYDQCASCGLPGSALQFTATFTDTFPTFVTVAVGLANTTFSYDPLTQGAITGIDASVDKNITTTLVGSGFGNSFRPMILQDGVFYAALIAGPTFSGPGGPGYLPFFGSLTESSFRNFDFATGTFGSANPDFDGNPLLLGLLQITTSPTPTTIVTQYDNLTFVVHVPEPDTIALFGAALFGFGWLLRHTRSNGQPGARISGR